MTHPAPDKIAVDILERCHDFIQAWATDPKIMTVDNYKASIDLRSQIDMYLGYCPDGQPECRATEPLPQRSSE